MPLVVGNDLVDLGEPSIADHHRRERFVARVCAPEERSAATTAAGLWSLFAAKEAAYKALVKLGYSPGFAHQELRVAEDRRSVTWRACRLRLNVDVDQDCVHALAWTENGPAPVSRIARRPEDTAEGAAARVVLLDLVSSVLGAAPSELEVVRQAEAGSWDGFGPPRLERNGAPIAVDVSLSHDGRFVAAAVLLVPDDAGRVG